MDRKKAVTEEQSSLKVSADVVSAIAETAACEIEGVKCITQKGVSFKHLIVKDKRSSSIRVKYLGDVLEISLSVTVLAGTKIKPLATAIQNKVKQDVQDMTGITVAKINVTVDDIEFPSDTAKS